MSTVFYSVSFHLFLAVLTIHEVEDIDRKTFSQNQNRNLATRSAA